MDGGVKEYAPISITLENNAEHVCAIISSPDQKPAVDQDCQTAELILVGTFGIFMGSVGESDVIDANRLVAQTGQRSSTFALWTRSPGTVWKLRPRSRGSCIRWGEERPKRPA